MNTPVADFLDAYAKSKTARFHMPGHKGNTENGSFDITEIEGAGNLYADTGIVAESEANAGLLFGSGRTVYSAEGSSQCIKAMLHLAKLEAKSAGRRADTVLAARNAHKAFVHALALTGTEPEWLYAPGDGGIESCLVTPEAVDAALRASESAPFAVYITSPDYLGCFADIAGIARVCRAHGVRLLVDNAHGAYLKFLSPSAHPLDLGAHMVCDSAHKTLPVLTGGAYLHLSRDIPDSVMSDAKQVMSVYGSSSPSYLILRSLDICNELLAGGYGERIRECVKAVCFARETLADAGFELTGTDGMRITLHADGTRLAEILRAKGIECEYADKAHIVFMLSPENPAEDIERLVSELIAAGSIPPAAESGFVLPKQVMRVRDALFSDSEWVCTDSAENRICAEPAVSCPPEIPLAVSGELIDSATAALMKRYGITRVRVVKKQGF